MDRCSLIKAYGRLAVGDSLTITYRDSSGATGQEKTPRILPLILTERRTRRSPPTASSRTPASRRDERARPTGSGSRSAARNVGSVRLRERERRPRRRRGGGLA